MPRVSGPRWPSTGGRATTTSVGPMVGLRGPGNARRRLRWALWRLGWVLLLTAFWSSGKIHLGTIWDLTVAIVVVAVFSVLVYRVKRLYEAVRQAAKTAWREGHREAVRQLARALAHLRE